MHDFEIGGFDALAAVDARDERGHALAGAGYETRGDGGLGEPADGGGGWGVLVW